MLRRKIVCFGLGKKYHVSKPVYAGELVMKRVIMRTDVQEEDDLCWVYMRMTGATVYTNENLDLSLDIIHPVTMDHSL
ncbi:hypothetical protein QQF64_022795 [Cirrhinus molitorella]|uniref:Uncharacterized protein n=1 Tax=Cirrhinus molitorella TaxID=172907 RepID=A0ABR3L6Q0_9TELE